jgi:ABC-type polysaccharide/polyol phosphate transport system ATPase subunit
MSCVPFFLQEERAQVPLEQILGHLPGHDVPVGVEQVGAAQHLLNLSVEYAKSRLQFGLSLAFDFDVYISDEVTSTGDAAFQKKAQAAFKALADHASLIMVSHSPGTLKQFCQAGVWLHHGQAHWFDDINEALWAYAQADPVKRAES